MDGIEVREGMNQGMPESEGRRERDEGASERWMKGGRERGFEGR